MASGDDCGFNLCVCISRHSNPSVCTEGEGKGPIARSPAGLYCRRSRWLASIYYFFILIKEEVYAEVNCELIGQTMAQAKPMN